VAELVDALGSGSSGCMPVGVRVPPSAPVASLILPFAMPITHHIDKRKGIIFAEVVGDFTLEDILNTIDSAVSDPAFRPGFKVLSDHRKIGEPATMAQMEGMAACLKGLSNAFGGTKWAMVVSKEASYGMMRMLSVLVEDVPIVLRVFWDMEEALKWLGSNEYSEEKK
jgi:hypothetical protein